MGLLLYWIAILCNNSSHKREKELGKEMNEKSVGEMTLRIKVTLELPLVHLRCVPQQQHGINLNGSKIEDTCRLRDTCGFNLS